MKSLNIIIARTYTIKRPSKINTPDRYAPADFFVAPFDQEESTSKIPKF
jgi:hypothetical protein